VSAGYYLPVIMVMYMKPAPSAAAHADAQLGRLAGAAVTLAVVGLLFFGVRPNRLLELSADGAGSLRTPTAAALAPPGH